MLRLVCLVGLAVLATCQQQCNFDGYHLCMKASRDSKHQAKLSEKPKENPIAQCLKQANCNVQQSEKSADKAAKFQQIRDCKKPIFDDIQKQVQQCVAEKIPGFQFPLRNDQAGKDHQGHGSHGHHYAFGGHLNKSCPDEKSRSAAKDCIQKLFKDKVQGHDEKRKLERCAAKKACLSKLSEPCQKDLANRKQTICDCAKSVFGAQGPQFESKLKNCFPEREANEAGAGRKGGRGGKSGGSFAERGIKKFCRQNKCK